MLVFEAARAFSEIALKPRPGEEHELEAIASVDGVDAIFLGPADLAANMGHVGNMEEKERQQGRGSGQALPRPRQALRHRGPDA